MSPLADAVRLVHRQEVKPRGPDGLDEPLAAKPLRNHIRQTILSGRYPVEPGVLFGQGQRAVDERDRHPERFELIDLVLHQRNQRGNDQRQPVEHDRRKLITETLASARRHDAQAIRAFQHRRNNLLAVPGRKNSA